VDRKSVERYRLGLFGRLIMGVAHEVDNHLSVVLGFAELIQIPGGADRKAVENAEKIFAAGERIAALVKHFSHHVRPHAPAGETFTLPVLLSELVLFGRYDLSRGNVMLSVDAGLPGEALRGDARDFGLALLAVLLNGAEAMAGRGGELRIRASREGDRLEVVVTDDGPGVPAAFLPRIFEEGFTTKPGAVHSGMGLPVARHIVSGFGGTLSVENLPSGGCASVIRVPAS
jgi:signal transduction histidine kinase